MNEERMNELENIELESIEQGHELVAECQVEMSRLMAQMREANDNETHGALTQKHYEMRNIKRSIQNKMGKLVDMRGKF